MGYLAYFPQYQPRIVDGTKVISSVVRASFAFVFEQRMKINKTTKVSEPDGYSLCILVPKDDTALVNCIAQAVQTAFNDGQADLKLSNGQAPFNFKWPVHDGDVEKAGDPNFAGHYYINLSSKKSKPQVIRVVDGQTILLTSDEQFYSGCYCCVSMTFKAYNNESKGIAAYLNNVLFVQDGERLSGGASAASDFGLDAPNAWGG